jgi:hypothetical protein
MALPFFLMKPPDLKSPTKEEIAGILADSPLSARDTHLMRFREIEPMPLRKWVIGFVIFIGSMVLTWWVFMAFAS